MTTGVGVWMGVEGGIAAAGIGTEAGRGIGEGRMTTGVNGPRREGRVGKMTGGERTMIGGSGIKSATARIGGETSGRSAKVRPGG